MVGQKMRVLRSFLTVKRYDYLVIEFQSTVNRFMAVRLVTYIGLFYQDLIRSKQLLANGQLPVVFRVNYFVPLPANATYFTAG